MTQLTDDQREIVYQLAKKELSAVRPAHSEYRGELEELIEVVTE